MALQFSAFDIEDSHNCWSDHLKITDGDGTTLLGKSCGSNADGNVEIEGQSFGFSLPPNMTSTSNIVKIHFISDYSGERSGWRIKWTAMTPGESPA